MVEYISQPTRNFIAMLGQRGVGKTETLKFFNQLLKLNNGVKVINLSGKKQFTDLHHRLYFIENFCLSLGLNVSDKMFDKQNLKHWFSVFRIVKEQLENYLKNNPSTKKIIFLIDEFSWFNLKKSDFFASFTSFYDDLGQLPITFIVTGSAIAWLSDKIIHDKGGLYHKVTRINLKPFDLFDTATYLLSKNPQLSIYEVVRYALYTGGIPRFLAKINPFDSIEKNVDNIFGSLNEFNENELENIFNYMFSSNSDLHYKAMRLFQNHSSLSAILLQEKLKISAATSQKILKELKMAGLIASLKESVIDKTKKRSKVRVAEEYRIKDLFCYYGFKSLDKGALLKDVLLNPTVNGLAFEIFCLNHVDLIKKCIGFNELKSQNYSWRNDRSQIDLVIDLHKQKFATVECKFYSDVFVVDKNYQKNINNKNAEFVASLPYKKQDKVSIETVFVSVEVCTRSNKLPTGLLER